MGEKIPYFYDFYNRRRINDWLNDDKRVKGCSRENVTFLREVKQLHREFSRAGVLTYFLGTRLGITSTFTMMKSAHKQKEFFFVVSKDLKIYRVDKEWAKVFTWDIDNTKRRVDHIFDICKRNLQLTEHWPYFDSVGFDRLLDFDKQEYSDNGETVLDVILPDMETWENEHRDEIEQYMESIKDKVDAHNAWIERKIQMDKQEKAERKARKKAENDEVKEIKKNREEYEKRKKKLDRELDNTVRRVWGGWNE